MYVHTQQRQQQHRGSVPADDSYQPTGGKPASKLLTLISVSPVVAMLLRCSRGRGQGAWDPLNHCIHGDLSALMVPTVMLCKHSTGEFCWACKYFHLCCALLLWERKINLMLGLSSAPTQCPWAAKGRSSEFHQPYPDFCPYPAHSNIAQSLLGSRAFL